MQRKIKYLMTDEIKKDKSNLYVIRAFKGLAVCIPLFILFALMGNTHQPLLYGHSIFSWLVMQWLDPGSQSGHGFLVPFVSIILLWLKRNDFKKADKNIDNRALIIIVISLFMYWAGYRSQEPRLGVIAFIMLAWSIPFYLWGKTVAGLMFFPSIYLFFAIPMGFLSALTFPLRLFSCKSSVFLLQGLGLTVLRKGTAIVFTGADMFILDVADPCSGLQSLIAMFTLTAVYAYLTQKTIIRKWILFLMAIPFAIIGNIIRIVTIGIVSKVIGFNIAMKIYHDYSGYIVFITAVILMMSFSRFLKNMSIEKWMSFISARNLSGEE